MILKSTMYKLVNKDGVVIAEGSKKDITKLQKQNRDCKIWISPNSKIGDILKRQEIK
jgi:hypothetical protein